MFSLNFFSKTTTILCGKTVQYSQGNWLLEHSQYCIRQNVLTTSDIRYIMLGLRDKCSGVARSTGHVVRAAVWPLVDDN